MCHSGKATDRSLIKKMLNSQYGIEVPLTSNSNRTLENVILGVLYFER